MKSWNPNLSSKVAIRSLDTRHFNDHPSISAASLGFVPGDLMNDLKTFNFIFSTFALSSIFFRRKSSSKDR